MKENFMHICAIIDESGSMYSSREDVIGGFQKMIDEQKEEKDGTCAISLYRFATTVKKDFIGKDVNEITDLDYIANSVTAMNDGIGTAIDKVGKWLSDMNEEDRPSKTLVVIMTDGAENASKEYSFDRVKEMIKHQEEKYNWTFMYMGTDITSMKDVKSLGIRMSAFSSREDFGLNYSVVNEAAKMYRNLKCDAVSAAATMDAFLSTSANEMTTKYETENNIKITNL
jgi:uncharacterized protein YegL